MVVSTRDVLATFREHTGVADRDLGADGYAECRERGDAEEREIAPSCQDVFQPLLVPLRVDVSRSPCSPNMTRT